MKVYHMDNFEEAIKQYTKKVIDKDGLTTYQIIYDQTTEIYNRRGKQIARPRYNEPQVKVKSTKARPVITPLGKFETMGAAARAHGVCLAAMWRWVNDIKNREFKYDKGA